MRQRAVAATSALVVVVVVATVAVLVRTLGSEGPQTQQPAPAPASSTATSTADAAPADPLAIGLGPAPFTPATYDGWLTEVPDDLSVSNGLPDDGGDFTRNGRPVTGEFCGSGAFPVGPELDVRRDGVTGPEFWDARDLRLFEDDRAAHRFVDRAAQRVGACPEELFGGTTWRNDVRDGDVGEEAVLLVRTYETDGLATLGATFWHLVRVGNAVLLTGASGEYMPGETLGTGIREQQRLLEPVVASMCVFSAERCG